MCDNCFLFSSFDIDAYFALISFFQMNARIQRDFPLLKITHTECHFPLMILTTQLYNYKNSNPMVRKSVVG